MKSGKEEKSRKTSQEARTLQEAKLHISDYDIDNYNKAYNYARRVFRAPLEDIY